MTPSSILYKILTDPIWLELDTQQEATQFAVNAQHLVELFLHQQWPHAKAKVEQVDGPPSPENRSRVWWDEDGQRKTAVAGQNCGKYGDTVLKEIAQMVDKFLKSELGDEACKRVLSDEELQRFLNEE